MAYSSITSSPFLVPGSAAGFLDIRKKGTTSPIVTVAVPALVEPVQNLVLGDSFSRYDGSSVPFATGGAVYKNTYPGLANGRLLASGLTGIPESLVNAYPGRSAAWLLNDTSTYNGVTPLDHFISLFDKTKTIVVYVYLGLNSYDINGNPQGYQAAYNDVKAVWAKLRAAGAKVITGPLVNSINSGHPSGNDDYRLPFNDLMFADKGVLYDGLADIEHRPEIYDSNAPLDPEYFPNPDQAELPGGSHLSTKGNAILAECFVVAQAVLLGQALGQYVYPIVELVAAGQTVMWSARGTLTYSTLESPWLYKSGENQAVNGVDNKSASVSFKLAANATGFEFSSWAYETFASAVEVRVNGTLVDTFSLRLVNETHLVRVRYESKNHISIPAGATISLTAPGGGGTFVITSIKGLA